MKTKYQVFDENNDREGGQCDTLLEAVLVAASVDRFGARFMRDNKARMRLYSSCQSIGNNPYIPRETDRFNAYSDLVDDDDAISDLCEELLINGVFHSKYAMSIVELEYDDSGVLMDVDGQSIEKMAVVWGVSEDEVRQVYEGNP